MRKSIKSFIFLVIIILGLDYNLSFAAYAGFNFGTGRIQKEVVSFKELKTRNIITQSLDYSCGPAVIATILTYYFNEKVTEKEIIAYLLLTANLERVKQRRGFSLLDLKNFAKSRGFNAIGYKMDLDFLSSLNKPVLIPIKIRDYDHFVVFRGLRRDRVFLADPVLGHLTMRVEKFLKLWRGQIGLVLIKEGKGSPDSPLMLSKEEESLLQDSSYVQRILGENALGRIFTEGEF